MDNFFATFFRRKREAPVQGVPASTAPQKQEKVVGGDYQSHIVSARGPESALMVSAVYRATTLRADVMGVMPVQYRKKDFEKGNFTPDMRGIGKRINYLLQEEPNPIMTATDMWRLVEINRLFYGNAFVYIERDEFGNPLHLWLVREGGYDLNTGTYASIEYLSDYGFRWLTNVPREDVMHFPNTFRHQINGFWGIPTLHYAIDALSLNRTIRSQTLETAAKGGRVKLIIGEQQPAAGYTPISQGLFDKNEMDDYAKELQQKMYNGHDVLAIRGLDKVQPISMTSVEMQMAEQAGMTYDDVARYWGVPRPLLMLDTNSHYNDYQNATMEFHTRTILPQKTGNEKEVARKLIGFRDYGTRDIHICEKPLLAMDPERQAKVDQLNLQNGAMTINEVRAAHDMPAVPDGDTPMASANLLTLQALIAKSDAATQLKPGNYTIGEEPTADEK